MISTGIQLPLKKKKVLNDYYGHVDGKKDLRFGLHDGFYWRMAWHNLQGVNEVS